MVFSMYPNLSFAIFLCVAAIARGQNSSDWLLGSSRLLLSQGEGASSQDEGTEVPFTSWLAKLYGKGLVISADPPASNHTLFWYARDNAYMRIVTAAEPPEYLSRFFVAQGPEPDVVYIRMSDFQYLCSDEENSNHVLRVYPAESIEDPAGNPTCQFRVTKIKRPLTSPRIDAINNDQFLLQVKSSRRYLQLSGGKMYAITTDVRYAEPLSFRDERNVIVDLGEFEQFLSNDKENPSFVLIKTEDEKFVSLEMDKHCVQLRDASDSVEYNKAARWKVTRISRLSNLVTLQNEKGYRFHSWTDCLPPRYGGPASSQFVFNKVGPGVFTFRGHPDNLYVDRASVQHIGTVLRANKEFAGQAEKFSLQVAESRLASMEIVDVEFDKHVTDTIPFHPDEVKIVKFRNDSPVEQHQDVEFSEDTTITTETTWSSSFFVESSVTVESSFKTFFAKGSVSASLSVGFSTDQGKTYSQEDVVSVSYAKSFTVPACTDMTIAISSAASQKTSVPFVATIRQTNVDGAVKLFRTTGSHRGVVLDQIRVSVSSTSIDSCAAAAESQRRLRGGTM